MADYIIHQAAATPSLKLMLTGLFYWGSKATIGFIFFVIFFILYSLAFSFLALAILKVIFPQNVGLFVDQAQNLKSLGALFPAPAEYNDILGYFIIPLCLMLGIALLYFTSKLNQNVFKLYFKNKRKRVIIWNLIAGHIQKVETPILSLAFCNFFYLITSK